MAGFLSLLSMPGASYRGPLPSLTVSQQETALLLERHVRMLAEEIGPRNIRRLGSMERTVQYLRATLEAAGYAVQEQRFLSHKVTSVNLEASLTGRSKSEEILVIGAHYDTVSGCPGANDNGSGVSSLLELARLLAKSTPHHTIRFVTFANEEPPFFPGESMGSHAYAAQCRKRRENLIGMLCLETMGFYSDAPGSQRYPFPFSLVYPDTADFIGFVGNLRSRRLVRQSIKAFRRHTAFPSEGLAAPPFVTGVGWSDHLSFWRQGYPAIMITDTAFYRYAPYHTPADTPDKLDYPRLARVVHGLSATILELAGSPVIESAPADGH